MLEGKNILFICPVFHDYHILIIEKLEELGAKVVFHAERDYSIWFKMVNNFSYLLLRQKQALHYRKIIKSTRNEKFDYLFVIRGYMISRKFIETFKMNNPFAKTVMYQWDSNRTNPFAVVKDCFDLCQSFDFEDCQAMRLLYLPLFYTKDIDRAIQQQHEIKYDFFFMGTYLPERYDALIKFRDSIKDNAKLKSFIYISPTSLKKEQMRGVRLDLNIVSTKQMSRKEYLMLLNESRVVVDVSNVHQTGLAMRIIEALASKKKIMTANNYIIKDPCYNPHNVLVFDPDNPVFDRSFVITPFDGNPPVLSLDKWIVTVLGLN